MSSKKNQSRKKKTQKQHQNTYKRPNRLEKMSRLSFALLFIIPFILGELLLYTGGRIASMYIFPLAWVGFWAALLYTNDWSPLIQRGKKTDEAASPSAPSSE